MRPYFVKLPSHLLPRHADPRATGCLGWFCYVAADVKKRDILAAALYSYFLNAWWIVLVITLYFQNADLQGI
jgi:hypothetical protein